MFDVTAVFWDKAGNPWPEHYFQPFGAGSRMRKEGSCQILANLMGLAGVPTFPQSELKNAGLDGGPDSWPRQGLWVTDCPLLSQEGKVTV